MPLIIKACLSQVASSLNICTNTLYLAVSINSGPAQPASKLKLRQCRDSQGAHTEIWSQRAHVATLKTKSSPSLGAPQAGHMLGSTMWPPTMGILSWGFQSKSFSSVFSFRGTASQFQTVLLSVTPVHPPHEWGQHLEVFCVASARAGLPPAAS